MQFRILGIVFAIIAFASDQYSKNLILIYFSDKTINILKITEFFNLCLVWNRGVSFGLFSNYTHAPIILLLTAGLIILILSFILYKSKNYYRANSLGLIIGGALGNIYDRYKYGAVIDFIEVHYKQYCWPAFNIADSLVLIGVALLLFEKKMVHNEN